MSEKYNIIEPYVTERGGVVIINGPFPIDQARRIASLCKAAPDLLEACKAALIHVQFLRSGQESIYSNEQISGMTDAAIAKAEYEED